MKRGRFLAAALLLTICIVGPLLARSEDRTLIFFWAVNCPHCLEAKPVIEELARAHPEIALVQYEIWNHPENLRLMEETARELGHERLVTPMIVLDERVWFGFSEQIHLEIAGEIEAAIGSSRPTPPDMEPPLILPFMGEVEPAALSLPTLTVVLGLLDSFNPCAFFVLFFLLSLMVHAHSRKTMLLVGGTFVLFSGLLYFLFMAAWLNLFFLVGHLRHITTAAALLALLFAAINIKDFFFFREGISLSIPEKAKPGLFRRMRQLVGSTRLPTVLAGTVVLALAANSYELLCTAGFPMVYTRVLTLQRLPVLRYYLYLALYNLVYIIPLAVIVALFAWTLGSRKLSEWQGRVLKLLSGAMMLAMGVILLIDPILLTRLSVALSALGGAIAGSLLLAFTWRILERRRRHR